eukprot:3093188-Prymnesium_polylepis.1
MCRLVVVDGASSILRTAVVQRYTKHRLSFRELFSLHTNSACSCAVCRVSALPVSVLNFTPTAEGTQQHCFRTFAPHVAKFSAAWRPLPSRVAIARQSAAVVHARALAALARAAL